MARFIEVTEAGSSPFLNVDAIAEFETEEEGAHITMVWSRGPGRQAVHSVREAVEEAERRIAEAQISDAGSIASPATSG
jgi:hypothetical protein